MTDQKFMREGLDFATAKLMEEMGELQAIIAKTMRFGWYSYNPYDVSVPRKYNFNYINDELKDLKGAIENFERQFNVLNMDDSVFINGLNN